VHIDKEQERRFKKLACGNSVASGGLIVQQDKEYIAAPARDIVINLCLSIKAIPRIKGRIKTIG
jgi:hypothetical protein